MSANNDYKFSDNVYSGDQIAAVARASRITGLQNISRAQTNGDPYSRSGNASRTIGPGWVINRPPRRVYNSHRRRHPLEMYSTKKDGDPALGVKYGTVAGLTPVEMVDTGTGLFGDALFANPPTGGGGFGILIATVTVTASLTIGIPTKAELKCVTVNPDISETTISVQVGSYNINPSTHAMTIFQALSGSISLIVTGATTEDGDTFLVGYWSTI